MDRQLSQIEDWETGRNALFAQPEADPFGGALRPVPSAPPAIKLRLAPPIQAVKQSARPVLCLVELLDLLLLPQAGTEDSPVWAEYSSHIALKLMQLYLTREPAKHATHKPRASHRSRQLSSMVTCLEPIFQAKSNFSAPLDHTLGNLSLVLCQLFPPVSGKVRLHVEGLDLQLSGFHHRVVSAIGLELLLNALQHGFFPGASGDIYMVVGRDTKQGAFLIVADNGRGLGRHWPGDGFRLISQLAGLIGAETILRGSGTKGTEIELRFPIPQQ